MLTREAANTVYRPIGVEEIGARDGEHLFVTDDADMFAQRVVTLLHDAALGQTLGKNARQWMQQHFSWDAKVASLEAAFERARQHRKEKSVP